MEKSKWSFFGNVILILALISLIAFLYFSIDIALMLFASFVITCALKPVVDKLSLKIPRGLAVALIIILLLLVILLIVVPLVSVCIKEITYVADNFTKILSNIEHMLNVKIFNVKISDFVTLNGINEAISQSAETFLEGSITAGKSIANFFTGFFAILIMVCYFSIDEKRLEDKFIEFFPQDKKQKAREILEDITLKLGNYVFAQAIAMGFVGLLTAGGLLLLHHDNALFLGFITCIFDIVPVLGPTLAVIIGLLMSVSNGIGYVLLVLTVYLIAQWAQNQFLRPIVFGKLLNMHPLTIIVALLLSARFLGMWGVILSPAIACVTCALIDELYLNKINKKED